MSYGVVWRVIDCGVCGGIFSVYVYVQFVVLSGDKQVQEIYLVIIFLRYCEL